MKLNILLKLKAWQLLVVSGLLLISSFLLFAFGPGVVKTGLVIWYAFNQLYLSSIVFGLKEKFPPYAKFSTNIFTWSIFVGTFLFALFISIAFGPDPIIENIILILMFVLVIGIFGIYAIMVTLRAIMIVESGRDVHYGDVFIEYLKTSFSPMGFFSYQKRVHKLI